MDPFALPRLSGIRVGGLLAIVCLLHCNNKVCKRKRKPLDGILIRKIAKVPVQARAFKFPCQIINLDFLQSQNDAT